MIRYYFFFILLCVATTVLSQTKFVSAYDFAGCGTKDVSGRLSDISNSVLLQCDCGVDNQAAIMNNNTLEFPATIDSLFKSDVTVCFDVLIENTSGEVDLMSKSYKCNADTAFEISYRVADSTFVILLKEGVDESYVLYAKADPASCWQNLCVSIRGLDIRVYVNGAEAAALIANDLLRLDNSIALTFNGSNCQFNNLSALKGRLDRIRFANYGFNAEDVGSFYIPQQQILTRDTIIFLGDQFALRAASECPSGINWSPAGSLSNPGVLAPTASPIVTTRYSASFQLGQCRLTDTVLVRVVDKDKLECENLRLPTAFTPNGDQLNDEFFISNPYLIESLQYFSILDRNGGIVFSTEDPQGRWDGTFKSKALNPGTFFYRIAYTCKGQEYKSKGSFFLMR